MSPHAFDDVPWDTLTQPSWNEPGEIARAFRAVASASTREEAHAAYGRFLYAFGNNSAGTYFPAILWASPHLAALLREGSDLTREIVLDLLIDLAASFAPEPGFERCVGPSGDEVDVREALMAGIHAIRSVVVACRAVFPKTFRAAMLASELLELVDDWSREPRVAACTSRFTNGCPPLVWHASSGRAGVVVMDASGSWGTGNEAAAGVRVRLAERMERDALLDPHAVALEIARAHAELPAAIRDEEFGWSFSIAVVLVAERQIHVAAMGSLSIVRVVGDRVTPLVTAPRMLDVVVAAGQLTREEAEAHPVVSKIFAGPFYGDAGAALEWKTLPRDDAGWIVIGDATLPSLIELGRVRFVPDAAALRDAVEAADGHDAPTVIVDLRADMAKRRHER